MTACFNGHKDIVRLLLDHLDIIDLNAGDSNGETAFMIACHYGHKDVSNCSWTIPKELS